MPNLSLFKNEEIIKLGVKIYMLYDSLHVYMDMFVCLHILYITGKKIYVMISL